MKTLFAMRPTSTKTQLGVGKKTKAKPKVVTLLDARRSNNVA